MFLFKSLNKRLPVAVAFLALIAVPSALRAQDCGAWCETCYGEMGTKVVSEAGGEWNDYPYSCAVGVECPVCCVCDGGDEDLDAALLEAVDGNAISTLANLVAENANVTINWTRGAVQVTATGTCGVDLSNHIVTHVPLSATEIALLQSSRYFPSFIAAPR